jgi:acetyltransferase-like isoleucine patch superfamily enzyme
VLEKLWGNVPVGPETQGRHVVGAVGKRWLHLVARYAPLPPATRAALHRRRGVHVGRRVFIGTEVCIDDAVPSAVTLEDDVTVIAQTTILGHTYYPRHFHKLLGDEDTRAELQTTIRRGAYLGLRSTILAGVTVGEFAIVAAGSVVTDDVAPYTMVAGVPARVVREFSPDDVG